MWLVIETSGTVCSAGIYNPATKHWLAYSRIEKADHSSVLPPMVNDLFEMSMIDRKEISSLVTNLGPGSFTGLRIGLAFLKGFHATFKPTLLATTTFKMLFYSLPEQERRGTVHTVVPMHRKKIYLQTFKEGHELSPVVLTVDKAKSLFETTGGIVISSEKTEWLRDLKDVTTKVRYPEASLIPDIPELEVINTTEVIFMEPKYVAEFIPHSRKNVRKNHLT